MKASLTLSPRCTSTLRRGLISQLPAGLCVARHLQNAPEPKGDREDEDRHECRRQDGMVVQHGESNLRSLRAFPTSRTTRMARVARRGIQESVPGMSAARCREGWRRHVPHVEAPKEGERVGLYAGYLDLEGRVGAAFCGGGKEWCQSKCDVSNVAGSSLDGPTESDATVTHLRRWIPSRPS